MGKKKAQIEIPDNAEKVLVSDAKGEHVKDVAPSFYNLYDTAINNAINSGKKELSRDFYILGIVFKDPTDKTSSRVQIRARYCKTCPTPTWLQTVYKYHYHSGSLKLLWTIPSRWKCAYSLKNSRFVNPDDYELLDFVKKFHSGELDTLCKIENKEHHD